MPSITIRISDETRDRLAEASTGRGITASVYVRQALEDHFRLEDGDVLESRPGAGQTPELTPVERRVLQMLHRITLAAKGDLTNEYYDAGEEIQAIQALENGFTAEYAQHEFAGIYDPLPQAECELAWDVLDMFRVIGASVRELGNDGWGRLEIADAERHGTFRGLDLNDKREGRLHSYIAYLVKSGRWEEQADLMDGGGNSHTRMLQTYRNMLREFKPRWKAAVRGFDQYLDLEALRAVLLAGGARDLKQS